MAQLQRLDALSAARPENFADEPATTLPRSRPMVVEGLFIAMDGQGSGGCASRAAQAQILEAIPVQTEAGSDYADAGIAKRKWI